MSCENNKVLTKYGMIDGAEEESRLEKMLKKFKMIRVGKQKAMKKDRNIITPSGLKKAAKRLSKKWRGIAKKRVIEVENARESGDLLDSMD